MAFIEASRAEIPARKHLAEYFTTKKEMQFGSEWYETNFKLSDALRKHYRRKTSLIINYYSQSVAETFLTLQIDM